MVAAALGEGAARAECHSILPDPDNPNLAAADGNPLTFVVITSRNIGDIEPGNPPAAVRIG
jgi:hypothetical protein